MRIKTTPKTGSFAGREVFTNNEGQGIFTKKNGQLTQHTGTVQTPTFKNSKQFSAWIRKNYPSA